MMDELHSPITTIPGIGTRMGAMILAEVGISLGLIHLIKFWLTPVFRSLHTNPGNNLITAMPIWRSEAPGTCALPSTTTQICLPLGPNLFAAYLAKKRAEGKHYNVAISHAAKKLVRRLSRRLLFYTLFEPSVFLHFSSFWGLTFYS